MAIHHALSGELINIRPLGGAITTARAAMAHKTMYGAAAVPMRRYLDA